MNKLLKPALACFFICSLFVVGQAQGSTTLRPGPPIERELSPNQVHWFTVDLEEKTLIQLLVEQKGIDVVIRVLTPEDKTLADYDTPNGAEGSEHISFVALSAGTYSLTVSPLNPSGSVKGRYQIKIVEIRKANEQELNTKKDLEIARAKAIELLKDLEGIISQIKSPGTRIKARLQASDLLCEDDEKRAEKYFADAIADLKEFIASTDVNDPNYNQYYATIWQLRFQIVQTLVEIDPDAALNLIYSTVSPSGPFTTREQVVQESNLEMSVANHIMSKDPRRALQIARKSLKQGYSFDLIRTVNDLKNHDAALAAEFANEIADKLLSDDILKYPETSQFAIQLLNFTGMAILPDDKNKQLLQKLLDEVLSFSPQTSGNGAHSISVFHLLHALKTIGAGLDKVVNGSAAAVERKYVEVTGSLNSAQNPVHPYSVIADLTLESIEKAPPEARDQLYLALANRETTTGGIQRAKQIINDHITNPHQRRNAIAGLEQQELYRVIMSGKTEEALRTIASLRTPWERAEHLVQMAGNLSPGLKRETALNLLEQARALLPPSLEAQDDQQMRALFEIARAFSRYDSKRAFEIVDPLVDQFNELCAAARTLDGFGGDAFENGELTHNGNIVAEMGTQLTSVLGSLALRNFERARAATERIRLPEVRLNAYLDIAQQAIEGGK